MPTILFYGMKLDIKTIILLSAIVLALSVVPEARGQLPRNLVLEYRITINDPSSHLVHVDIKIENNRPYNEIVLERGMGGAATAAPILNLAVKSENDLPYQIAPQESGGERLHIPSVSIQQLRICYDANLSNNDKTQSTTYYLSEEYGVVEWNSFLYFPLAPHASEDLESEYGANRNQFRIIFSLPPQWKEICALPKEDSIYTWSHNCPTDRLNGPVAFLKSFVGYTRKIGGVEVSVIFHPLYSSEAQSALSNDVFTIFSYGTRKIGDLSENQRIPTHKYIVIFVPEIDGVFPKNGKHDAHGYFRGDLFDMSRWENQANEVQRLFGGLTLEGFISANTSAIRNIDGIHEGLITLIGYNGWVESGRWTAAEKNERLINVSFHHYSKVAGTEQDRPVYDPNHTSEYVIGYFKCELVWHLIDELMKNVTSKTKDIGDICKYLFRYHALIKGGVGVTTDNILSAINGITRFDFSKVFDNYVYGAAILPFYVDENELKIVFEQLPEIVPYNPPEAPMNLRVTRITDSTASLRWEARTQAEGSGYNIYRTYGNSVSGPNSLLFQKINESPIPGTAFFDSEEPYGLSDTFVYYVVTAVNASGQESLYSNMVCAAKKGDVDYDGKVGVGDAIFALRELSNVKRFSNTFLSGDVNGDGVVGMEEVVYVLQGVCGLR